MLHRLTAACDTARWRKPLAVALLSLAALQQAAHADIWAYVDSRGVTHFAAEQIDANYALFFKGDQFDSTTDMPTNVQAQPETSVPDARRLAFFDISADYKRVRLHIRSAAEQSGLDYELLKAVIATESGFDTQAVSPRGAIGLMQLMPATASRFGVAADRKRTVAKKLEDPATNLSAGASYLSYLMRLFEGRKDLALAAYNAGEGAVQRAGNQIPDYRETRNYVKSVLGLYAMLKPPEPLRAHRAVSGRVRMELPAGPRRVSDVDSMAGSPAAALIPTISRFNPAAGEAADAHGQTAARDMQEQSANE